MKKAFDRAMQDEDFAQKIKEINPEWASTKVDNPRAGKEYYWVYNTPSCTDDFEEMFVICCKEELTECYVEDGGYTAFECEDEARKYWEELRNTATGYEDNNRPSETAKLGWCIPCDNWGYIPNIDGAKGLFWPIPLDVDDDFLQALAKDCGEMFFMPLSNNKAFDGKIYNVHPTFIQPVRAYPFAPLSFNSKTIQRVDGLLKFRPSLGLQVNLDDPHLTSKHRKIISSEIIKELDRQKEIFETTYNYCPPIEGIDRLTKGVRPGDMEFCIGLFLEELKNAWTEWSKDNYEKYTLKAWAFNMDEFGIII